MQSPMSQSQSGSNYYSQNGMHSSQPRQMQSPSSYGSMAGGSPLMNQLKPGDSYIGLNGQVQGYTPGANYGSARGSPQTRPQNSN
mmetsp:Transcript_7098/g.10501  ORF Transcript_7098/g.10501 Transcript_7098/m.10501 type:complete len:85 (-) Transcript_7098:119-373(-)